MHALLAMCFPTFKLDEELLKKSKASKKFYTPKVDALQREVARRHTHNHPDKPPRKCKSYLKGECHKALAKEPITDGRCLVFLKSKFDAVVKLLENKVIDLEKEKETRAETTVAWVGMEGVYYFIPIRCANCHSRKDQAKGILKPG